MTIFIWVLQLLFVPAVSPLCVGVIKKIKAKMQNRDGASIFQPYNDLWKLLHKDEIISKDASWIFLRAPIIVFSVTVIVGASIPIFASFLNNSLTSDLFVLIYALAIGTFFLALAGLDTGGAFGGFGSSREMTVSALAEGGFIFSLLTVALLSGTTNVFAMLGVDAVDFNLSFLPLLLSFCGFFIVLLAETARFPFDNPATHLELTMIHEAMILEYSGKRLALMEWAAANKLVIFAVLGANLFFPFGTFQFVSVNSIFVGIVSILVKIFIVCFVVAILESVIAKYRFFRLPDLLILSFILNVVAIGLIH